MTELSLSASSSKAGGSSEYDQSTQFMMERLRQQQTENPTGYANEIRFEFFRNIIVAEAGNRTTAEKHTDMAAAQESIEFHFTVDRIDMAITKYGDLWPPSFTADTIQRIHSK
jgi:hypothetical protein